MVTPFIAGELPSTLANGKAHEPKKEVNIVGRPTMSYEWVTRIMTMYCSPEAYMLPDPPSVAALERKLAEVYPTANYGEPPSYSSIEQMLNDLPEGERLRYRNRWH